MGSTRRIYEALGGKKVLRKSANHCGALSDHVRSGLPYAAVEAVAERFDIPKHDLLRILHLSLRTLARRKKERTLHADESDRLLRLGRIAAALVDAAMRIHAQIAYPAALTALPD